MAICTPNCSVLQPLLQPACVLLFVGKCSPSGPCPPAECPRKSCSINAEVHLLFPQLQQPSSLFDDYSSCRHPSHELKLNYLLVLIQVVNSVQVYTFDKVTIIVMVSKAGLKSLNRKVIWIPVNHSTIQNDVNPKLK